MKNALSVFCFCFFNSVFFASLLTFLNSLLTHRISRLCRIKVEEAFPVTMWKSVTCCVTTGMITSMNDRQMDTRITRFRRCIAG